MYNHFQWGIVVLELRNLRMEQDFIFFLFKKKKNNNFNFLSESFKVLLINQGITCHQLIYDSLSKDTNTTYLLKDWNFKLQLFENLYRKSSRLLSPMISWELRTEVCRSIRELPHISFQYQLPQANTDDAITHHLMTIWHIEHTEDSNCRYAICHDITSMCHQLTHGTKDKQNSACMLRLTLRSISQDPMATTKEYLYIPNFMQ